MAAHTNLGNIAIPVGAYESQGATKKRYRNIGVLMETARDDGTKHLWVRLNLDIFHASLYALVRSVCGVKGDDTVIAAVFEPRPAGKPAQAAQADDDVDADGVPF